MVPLKGGAGLQPQSNFYLARVKALNFVLLLVLLLTFGISYPPLALSLLLNVVITIVAFQLSMYLHSLQVARLSPKCQRVWTIVVREETAVAHKIIYGCRTVVYLFSCVFACSCLYDISAASDRKVAVIEVLLFFVVTVTVQRVLHRSALKRDRTGSISSDGSAWARPALSSVGELDMVDLSSSVVVVAEEQTENASSTTAPDTGTETSNPLH